PDVGRDEIFPDIGPFGCPVVLAKRIGDGGWQVNCQTPRGLGPGWYYARLRIRRSAQSNTVRLPIDLPEDARNGPSVEAASTSVRIHNISDGNSWTKNLIRVGPDSSMALWA